MDEKKTKVPKKKTAVNHEDMLKHFRTLTPEELILESNKLLGLKSVIFRPGPRSHALLTLFRERLQQQVAIRDQASTNRTLGERIAHVGGRENAAGYLEFGSPMALGALIQGVIRDLLRAQNGNAVATLEEQHRGAIAAILLERNRFLTIEQARYYVDAIFDINKTLTEATESEE